MPRILVALATLSLSLAQAQAQAGDLTFIADAVNPGNGKKYKAYIGFLDAQENVIVEEKYPRAPDEPFSTDSVDRKVEPYLCPHLTDPRK
jgi:hypothetical protein